jgi:hypothetical protein
MKNNMLPNHQRPGFKVPENYFEDLEAGIMAAVDEKQLLENLKFKANPGFTVPDEYFSTLENKVLEKIGQPHGKGKVISLFNNTKFYYATAAAAVFIAIISTYFFNPVGNNFTIDSLELSAIERYIDDGHINLNYNEISAFMIEEGYSFDNFNTSGLSDEEVFNYLSENVEDPNLLYE